MKDYYITSISGWGQPLTKADYYLYKLDGQKALFGSLMLGLYMLGGGALLPSVYFFYMENWDWAIYNGAISLGAFWSGYRLGNAAAEASRERQRILSALEEASGDDE